MSDSPSIKIPAAWLKAALPPLIAAILAATGASKYVEKEVDSIRTGSVNRSDQNAHEVAWCVGQVIQLRARVEALEQR